VVSLPSQTTLRLWDVDHPYYCSDANYYVGGEPKRYPWGVQEGHVPWDHVEFESWDDFDWKDSDPDMNLLFRWDWKVPDPDDYDEGEDLGPEKLYLYWMLQRKGRFMIVSFPVQRDEEPAIREWLETRWQHMRRLWEPFA
jgi:hypothetical protein